MKIVYLRTLFELNLKAGGSVGHTAGVIHALSKLVELDIISNSSLADVKEKTRIVKPWIVSLLPHGIKELLYNVQLIVELNKKDFDCDAIYHRHAAFSFGGSFFAKKYNVPLILEFNSSDVWKIENWNRKEKFLRGLVKKIYHKAFALPVMRAIENYNLRMAAVIVVVSEVLRDILVAKGVPADKILINPNGVDCHKFSPECGGETIRNKYRLNDKFVAGFIGTFGQWHGIRELGLSIVNLIKKHPEIKEQVKFLLVGDGVLMPELKQIIAEGNVEDNVVLTGLVPQNMASMYLDACDIFVSPHVKNPDGTKFFGSPTKLFEYMAMQKGIVASELDQIADILEHKKTAYMVEPGNVEALEQGIYMLFNEKDLREQLGKNARKQVLENYTWDIHVKKILKKFKESRCDDEFKKLY